MDCKIGKNRIFGGYFEYFPNGVVLYSVTGQNGLGFYFDDMKLKKSIVLPALEKGQLWKTEKGHVEIMEVGKTLTHYRLYQSQKRVPTSLGRIQMVQDFLRDNQAKLVKNDRHTKTKG